MRKLIKVVGGEFRGRNLVSVPGESTRPPLARVRAAVASILAEYTEGAKILDLFAGTGSYSIELLSRGALSAVCIDKNPRAIEVIKKNVSSLKIGSRVRIMLGDALRLARTLELSREKFRIIINAPPYFEGLDKSAMDILGSSSLLEPGGIVVLQQHKREETLEAYGNLRMNRTYSYGETKITTYLSP
ncbi:MAG: 16S rRNA (guanine(966)-N(2))-methyltransferase RsmD [Bacillota bacterium]